MSEAKQETATRKHLYLITEHEEEDRVGGVSFTDTRLSRARKNQETPIHQLDDDERDIVQVGKHVALGYVDFESEADYEENAVDAMKRKLNEVDEKWIDKAGLDDVEGVHD